MTRIIAGIARGRRLKVPKSGTRPTSDRVRESIFSSLDHLLGSWEGLSVLDLYAGTGALAFEALSRGASQAVAVDNGAGACATIRENAAHTDLAVDVVRADVGSWIDSRPDQQFDLVFLDPPYETETASVATDLARLLSAGLLNDGAAVVVEYPSRSTVPNFPSGFGEVTDRRFGDTTVSRAIWYVSDNPN
jgi:16S rRNA (guanine966-N2)-methyltransferase